MTEPFDPEARIAAIHQRILDAFQTTWLDPLLSGPDSVLGPHPYGCPSVERLIQAIKARIELPLADLLAERDRLLARLQTETWQPIETAPKDGRVLLSWWGQTPQFIGWIDGEGWRVLMPPARGMGFGIHGNFAPFHPTHWMPLPDPPAALDAARTEEP